MITLASCHQASHVCLSEFISTPRHFYSIPFIDNRYILDKSVFWTHAWMSFCLLSWLLWMKSVEDMIEFPPKASDLALLTTVCWPCNKYYVIMFEFFTWYGLSVIDPIQLCNAFTNSAPFSWLKLTKCCSNFNCLPFMTILPPCLTCFLTV